MYIAHIQKTAVPFIKFKARNYDSRKIRGQFSDYWKNVLSLSTTKSLTFDHYVKIHRCKFLFRCAFTHFNTNKSPLMHIARA